MRKILGFLKIIPKVEIIDGMVHITGPRGELVCHPSTMRKFIETTRRKLDAWEASRVPPTPIRPG